jgi:hypothetical protein
VEDDPVGLGPPHRRGRAYVRLPLPINTRSGPRNGDWGLAKLTVEQRHDLLELLDDRHGSRSTVVTSQLPLDHWREIIGNPTLADAILDRLEHSAFFVRLPWPLWWLGFACNTVAPATS